MDEPVLTRRNAIASLDAALDGPVQEAGGRTRALADQIAALRIEDGRIVVCRAVFDRLLQRLYDAAGPLGTSTGIDREGLLRALATTEALRDRLLPLLGERSPDALTEVERELRAIGLSRRAPEDEASARNEVLDAMDRLQMRRAEGIGAEEDPETHPGRPLQLLSDRIDEFIGRGRRTYVGQLEARRRAIWAAVRRNFLAREGLAQHALVERLADDLEERGEDALARAEDLTPAIADRLLSHAIIDVRRGLALCRRAGATGRLPPLARLKARLVAQRGARRVRMVQVRQVGARLLRGIDYLLFGLILTILVSLVLRLFGPSEAELVVLERIDAIASGLLLLEFLWRFGASGWSRRYFLRHVATDVLPSVAVLFLFTRAGSHEAGFGLALALRFLRPAIEIARLIAFTARAADRLVDEQRELWNRNIILFERTPRDDEAGRRQAEDLFALHQRLARRLRMDLRIASDTDASAATSLRFAALKERLEDTAGGVSDPSREISSHRREVRLEVLIEGLLTLEPEAVKDALGERAAVRLSRVLAALDLPIVRSLPILRHVVRGLRQSELYAGLALAGRGLGRALDEAMDRIRVFDDLQGIVTGSQLVDRLGAAIVKATQRPAIRLMKFGVGTVIVGWIVSFIPSLAHVHTFLSNVLGAMVWIGSVCLIFWSVGQWLRRVAGEATELCQRIAEAQGINLLEREKLKRSPQDRDQLWQRVLQHEARRLGIDPLSAAQAWVQGGELDLAGTHAQSELASLAERVDLLYQDFLDGAVLHKSNVRTTEQALGNLDLRAIRERRLALPRREQRALERLDLDQKRPIPTGPSLWFRFITDSLAQKTARLILAYNAHLVPLAQRARLTKEECQTGDRWLDGARTITRRGTEERLELGQIQITRFHALHFLSNDAKRDARVQAEYGTRVLERLQRDRRRMVREVFATRGWEHLPPARRMVNPFALYGRYLAGGRFLWLPLRLLARAGFLLFRAGQAFARILRSVLRGETGSDVPDEGLHVNEDSIIRKINRMHRPLFMELSLLRARFDPEWHGLALPGCPEPPVDFGFAQEDLEFAGCRAYEREHVREFGQAQERALQNLQQFLLQHGWPERSLLVALASASGTEAVWSPIAGADEREAMRAVALAYIADEQGVRTAIEGRRRLFELSCEALERAEEDGLSGLSPAWTWVEERRFRMLLKVTGHSEEASVKTLRKAYNLNALGLRTLTKRYEALGGPDHALRRACAALGRAARHPAPYTQELVSLRAVQTLARFDIEHARDHVLELAGLRSGRKKTPGANSGGE